MAHRPAKSDEFGRRRPALLSKGHEVPKYVDDEIPTFETRIEAEGGPGGDEGQGTNPWIAGSLTIGSGKVWAIDRIALDSSSPNVWYKFTHNHPGTATVPGGTLESIFVGSGGHLEIQGRRNDPVLAIRGPGTVQVEVFGARQNRSRSDGTLHEALGTNPGDLWAVLAKGRIL